MAVVLGGAAVAGATWAGAALAARIGGARAFTAGLGEALGALVRLPAHLSAPAAAWPEPASSVLPGPALYWAAQAVVLAGVVALAGAGWALLRAPRERDGLGVERSARFARRRDLRRLVVAGPVPGRMVLGRAAGRLVATEPRTSVCVVGPSQAGKTTGLCVPVLLELGPGDGAVLAVSVKGDLYEATRARRAALGEVKVFDPTAVLGATRRTDTWTPLRAAAGVSGAQAAARALVDAAGTSDGLQNARFWDTQAKELLWPLLFVAARSGDAMDDVVTWVMTQDRGGEVDFRLRRIEAHDPVAARPARRALEGHRGMDERTRSDVAATARGVVEAWSDPQVARASDGCAVTPEWLFSGDNTVYVVAPGNDQDRLHPVFSGLVADVVRAAFDLAARRPSGRLPRRLLALLDEAANVCPLKELPAWHATCASSGITLLTAWQDRSQQRTRYGPDGAETLWNNAGARLVLSGVADRATAEVAASLGEEDHARSSSQVDVASGGGPGGGAGRRSVGAQAATRRLVGEDALRRQPPGQALLVYRNLPPVRLALRPWYDDRRLRALQAAGCEAGGPEAAGGARP